MLAMWATFDWTNFGQQTINGLTIGSLIALIALGYTMVYGIVELINFAHGDLFMLGSFLALSLVSAFGLNEAGVLGTMPGFRILGPVLLCFLIVPLFCAGLNLAVDRVIYKPLRNAPKLAPLVSAIGVSFIFMNIGLFWGGAQDVNFPDLVAAVTPAESADGESEQSGIVRNLLEGSNTGLRFTVKDAMVIGVTVPLMLALSLFVSFTKTGRAMRATAQNPTAAQLMGINVDWVIGVTFFIGGAMAGFGSVMYSLTLNTVGYQMGFQNGLYAFTAAVLGGIGNIYGAVLGGIVIGLVRSLGSEYVGETWTSALVFAVLIVILVFRPSGLLGSRTPEKV